MTAVAATARPDAGAARRSPFVRTIQHQLAMQLRLGAWFWAVILVGVSVVTVLVATLGTVETSIVQYARQGTLWFPFSMMVLTVMSGLTPHVASGMTRRSFAAASAVVALVLAVAYAAILVGLLQIERVVYAAAGWPQTLTDTGLDLTSSASDIGPLLISLTATGAAATASGLLVGIVYYRAGGWWGTLALPLTVGPILGVGLLVSSAIGPITLPVVGEGGAWAVGSASGLALRAVACAVVVAIMLAVHDRLTRGAALGKPAL
ncbi:hypothetical protein ACGIF2_09525 [Cellulomonas sp. P22]|uniref:hypothetical protein n=1 Tax=Cellulomonas sp. P22 TaxID=3373189 RepID=UPI0037A70C67